MPPLRLLILVYSQLQKKQWRWISWAQDVSSSIRWSARTTTTQNAQVGELHSLLMSWMSHLAWKLIAALWVLMQFEICWKFMIVQWRFVKGPTLLIWRHIPRNSRHVWNSLLIVNLDFAMPTFWKHSMMIKKCGGSLLSLWRIVGGQWTTRFMNLHQAWSSKLAPIASRGSKTTIFQVTSAPGQDLGKSKGKGKSKQGPTKGKGKIQWITELKKGSEWKKHSASSPHATPHWLVLHAEYGHPQ